MTTQHRTGNSTMTAITKTLPADKAGKNTKSLKSIVGQIKALEKRTVTDVVEIGRLLELANGQCVHGQWLDWLAENFSWSDRTARRYRNAFEFSKSANLSDLDISISALHLLVDCPPDGMAATRMIAAANKGRVSYSTAKAIIDEVSTPIEPLPDEAKPPARDITLSVTAAPTIPLSPTKPDDPEDGEIAPGPTGRTRKRLDVVVTQLRVLGDGLPMVDMQAVIEEVGPVAVREIVNTLKAALDTFGAKNTIKSKADRAEAKNKTRITTPTPAASEDNASAAWRATTLAAKEGAAPVDYPELPAALDRKLH